MLGILIIIIDTLLSTDQGRIFQSSYVGKTYPGRGLFLFWTCRVEYSDCNSIFTATEKIRENIYLSIKS